MKIKSLVCIVYGIYITSCSSGTFCILDFIEGLRIYKKLRRAEEICCRPVDNRYLQGVSIKIN